MKKSKKLIISLLVFVLLNRSAVFSDQEQKHGRLPDGRAYRIDAEGNQLIDYIAELEINVDTLNHQVKALENEVESKVETIGKIKADSLDVNSITEKDLVNNKKGTKVSVSPESSVSPETGVSPESRLKTADFSAELKKLQDTQKELLQQQNLIQQLKEELKVKNQKLEVVKENSLKNNQDTNNLLVKLQHETTKQENVILQLKEELEKQKNLTLKSENQEKKTLQNELRRVKEELRMKELETVMHKENADYILNEASTKASLARELEDGVQRNRQMEQVVLNVTQQNVIRETNSADNIKRKTRSEFSNLISKVSMRDKLYRQYGSNANGLTLKPQEIVTVEGETVESLEKRLSNAYSQRDFALIINDIKELNSKVEKDVNFIRKFQR